MTDKIEKFNPSTLMQGVKDKIKATFVGLIPDNEWEKMVKKEVDDYFKTKSVGYSSHRNPVSDFHITVKNLLDERTRTLMKEYLSAPEFMDIWNNNGIPVASEAVKKMIIENSGEMLLNMIGGVAQQAVSQMRNVM